MQDSTFDEDTLIEVMSERKYQLNKENHLFTRFNDDDHHHLTRCDISCLTLDSLS